MTRDHVSTSTKIYKPDIHYLVAPTVSMLGDFGDYFNPYDHLNFLKLPDTFIKTDFIQMDAPMNELYTK